MEIKTLTLACLAVGLAFQVRSQTTTPGAVYTVSGVVNGTVTVGSQAPGGCATRVCTTNLVTFSRCYTNWWWQRVCTTNSAGLVQCTNVPVLVTHCYTNTFPEITCTNQVTTPTSVNLSEQLSGPLAAVAGCDELLGQFPTDAVFQATLHLTLRTNDWVGTQAGSFRILSGTNVLAFGSMTGVSGLGTPVAGGTCGVCNHIQGVLNGAVLRGGPVPGAHFEAAYAGDLTGVTCPSADVPQGAITLLINGVATTPCRSLLAWPTDDALPKAPN